MKVKVKAELMEEMENKVKEINKAIQKVDILLKELRDMEIELKVS